MVIAAVVAEDQDDVAIVDLVEDDEASVLSGKTHLHAYVTLNFLFLSQQNATLCTFLCV